MEDARGQAEDARRQMEEAQASRAEGLERIGELHELLDEADLRLGEAAKLARKTGAFPFLIFFQGSKRYRRLRRRLRNSADLSARLRSAVNAASISLGGSVREPRHGAGGQPAHPGGQDAEMVEALSLDWTRTSYVDGAIRGPRKPRLDDLAAVIAGSRRFPDALLVASFSHDNYLEVTGGTQICVEIEAGAANRMGHDYLNVHPVRPATGLMPEADAASAEMRVVLNGEVLGVCSYADLRDGLRDHTPFRVVVHHLLGHDPAAVAEVAALSERRVLLWTHDYFLACRSPHLLRNTIRFCGAPPVASSACRVCVFGDSREDHLRRTVDFLRTVEPTMLSPSGAARDILAGTPDLPDLDGRVLPHRTLDWRPRTAPAPERTGPARIAFLGAPVAHKGWDAFRRVALTAPRDVLVPVYLGNHRIDLDIESHEVRVTQASPNAMIDALRNAKIDMVIQFSSCPETFSFTAAEALEAGAWVVTSAASGNVAALVRETGRGVIFKTEADLVRWVHRGIASTLEEARAAWRREVGASTISDMAMTILAEENA